MRIIVLVLVLFPSVVLSWETTFGGEAYDRGHCIIQVCDGCLIIAGETESFGNGNNDVYIVKADREGELVWFKTFGYHNGEAAYAVSECEDAGLIITGVTSTFEPYYNELYLIRTDPDGNLIWEKAIGGEEEEIGYAVFESMDSCFVAAGVRGFSDPVVYLVKTDRNGEVLWEQTLAGGTGRAALETTDGGIIIAGHTGNWGGGDRDILIIKTDRDGTQEWLRTFPCDGDNRAYAIAETADGGFIISGYNDVGSGVGRDDIYLLKVDGNGNQLWDYEHGESNDDRGYSVIQTDDGGFAVCGETYSFDVDHSDVYVVKTDQYGRLQWEKTFGGYHFDGGTCLIEAANGDLVATGTTMSYGAGLIDVYLINIEAQTADPLLIPDGREKYTLSNFPSPFSGNTSIAFMIPQPGVVHLDIYNARGEITGVLVHGYLDRGCHQISWQPSKNGKLASGVYWCRLQLNGSVLCTRPMTRVR